MKMKPEAKFWGWLRERITHSRGFEFERIENRVGRSTPDVCFSWNIENQRSSVTRDITSGHGWIELKAIREVSPNKKVSSEIVKVPHFTKGQKRWLSHRGAMGGFCYLLLEAGDTILLIDHMNSYAVGSKSWNEMVINSVYCCTKDRFTADQFLALLISDHR